MSFALLWPPTLSVTHSILVSLFEAVQLQARQCPVTELSLKPEADLRPSHAGARTASSLVSRDCGGNYIGDGVPSLAQCARDYATAISVTRVRLAAGPGAQWCLVRLYGVLRV